MDSSIYAMTPRLHKLLAFGLAIACILGKPIGLSGQGLGGGENSRIEDKFRFMPIPYVNYDRSFGCTLVAIPRALSECYRYSATF